VRTRAFAFVVLAAACWGTGTVLSKTAVREIPPLTLLAVQLAVSIAMLTVAVRLMGVSVRETDRRLVVLGILNPGLAYALSLIGLTVITASASVLVWAMEPVLILLFAGIVLHERPGRFIAALSLAAFLGLAVATGSQVRDEALIGLALSLAGVACCVVYSIAARTWIEDSPSTLGVVALQDVAALVVVGLALAASAMVGSSPLPASLTPAGLVSAAASGALYYGAAYLLYLSALRELPVSIAAISFYLVPVFGIAVATVGGETLSSTQWVGATTTVLAVLAVGAVDIRRSPSPRPPRA
jgi:probable blue pigment (indigoidine) exporter